MGSGKTALMLALCRQLRDKFNIAAVTNDIFTKEDGEFLIKNEALPAERIVAIETGTDPSFSFNHLLPMLCYLSLSYIYIKASDICSCTHYTVCI